MLSFIVQKEVLKRIYDLRFALLLVISVVLAMAAALLFQQEFGQQLRTYNQMSKLAFEQTSLERTYVLKPPNALAFIDASERDFTNQLRLQPNILYYVEESGATPSLVETGARLDWVFIFIYVYSFFAAMMTYDAIAGEKELGTLRLMLSNSCSRSQVILGSLLGNTLALWIPLLIVSLLSVVMITLSQQVQLTTRDWLGLGWAVLLSGLFVMVAGQLGLLASTLFQRTSTALIVTLVIWVTLIVIVPNGVRLTVEYLRPIPSLKDLQDQLWSAKMEKFQGQEISGLDIVRIISLPGLTETQKRERIAAKQSEIYAKHERSIEKFNLRTGQILQDYYHRLTAQAELVRAFSRCSPASAYEHALEKVLPAGYWRHQLFINSARQYLSDYTQIASSLKAQRRNRANVSRSWTEVSDEVTIYRLYGIDEISYADVPFDKQQLPQFRLFIPNLEGRIKSALWDLATLLFFTLIIFSLTYVRFLTYDVR
jgi:ABC-type transport system involved in multi-copper enzyme maturation permease subunit